MDANGAISPGLSQAPSESRAGGLRGLAAWVVWPAVMGGSVAAAAWGLAHGFSPDRWAFAVSAGNFVLVLALEALLPGRAGVSAFRDRQSWNDIGHGVLVSAFARPLAGAIVAGALGWLALSPVAAGGAWWPHGWPLPAQIALTLVLVSGLEYWMHRSFHAVGWLWPFHALHHSARQMHVLKGNRLHFGEELIRFLLVPIPLLVVGVPAGLMMWMALWSNFEGSLAHSNVDQRFPRWLHYLVPTVRVHFVHHSAARGQQDSNYGGTTSLWDVLFGTFRHPDDNPIPAFGLEGDPVPDGFVRQLAQPLGRRSRALLRG